MDLDLHGSGTFDLNQNPIYFSGSTQLGKSRFYKFYFICELETWFFVGLKWQIICRFFVSFNLRCVVHNLVGLDPEPHGCELLPGSGSAWMRTFTWIRIHMDANFYLDPDPHGCKLLPGSGSASRIWKIQFAFGSGSGMNHLLFTTLHVRTCLATVLLRNSFSRLFFIFLEREGSAGWAVWWW